MFYFTLYCAPKPLQLLKNIARWLKPRGWLCMHAVDPLRFDPVLDAANPLVGISRQRYLSKRQVESKVFLQNCVYRSRFDYDCKKHRATFHETIVYPRKSVVRKHEHSLSMPPLGELVRTIRRAGFRLQRVLHLMHLGYEYQYLCILQKKN